MTTFPRRLTAFLTLVLLVLLAGGARFHHAQYVSLRHEVEQNLMAIAQLKVEQIADWRSERLDEAAEIMQRPMSAQQIAPWLADPRGATPEDLLTRFGVMQKYDRYYDILVVDAGGQVRVSLLGRTGPLHAEAMEALADAFRARRPLLSELHSGDDGQPPHIDAVAPLFAANGTGAPVGAIVLQSDARCFLYPLIGSWPTPSRTAETMLVRRDGDALLFLNELRHQKETALRLRIPLSRTDAPAVMAALDREGVVQGRDYRGVEVLSALKAIPDSSWFLVSKVDADEALAFWRLNSMLILALSGALALAAIAAVALVWQRNAKAHYRALFREETERRRSQEQYGVTLMSIGDGVITTDAEGRVELVNPVAEDLTGWRQQEARGRPLEEVFLIVNEETRRPVENPVRRVVREGAIVGLANHTLLIARDGSQRPIADSGAPIRDASGATTGVVLVFRDQTSQQRYHREREISLELLRVLNHQDDAHELVHAITGLLSRWTGCAAVGVRLREGDDFPYFETRGFSQEFVLSESPLCARDLHGQLLRDGDGHPVLDCMCGNVLCGRFDPAQPFFTAKGSFWTNCTTQLLATTTEAQRQARTRNRCNGEGYESVALIPLRCGDQSLGLLQINDRATDRFTPELVAFLESAADQIAIALAQRHAQAALRQGEEHYRSLFENMLNGFAYCRMVFEKDRPADFVYLNVNRAFETLTGLKSVIGKQVSEVIPGIRESDPQLFETYGRVARTGVPEHFETYVEALKMWFSISVYCPRPDHFVAIFDVITERKRAEEEKEKLQEQLLQSQKMESVGRLAGGVAHDFNNMLQAIMGNADLALSLAGDGGELCECIREIQAAAQRSADLTRQLLAFARRQTVNPQTLDLNDNVAATLKMLRRLIGEDIDLAWQPGANLWPVHVDPSQLDQILANLAVNARDAMAGGGKLTIETDNVNFDAAYCADHPGFVPGEFVLLAISDSGVGMDKQILEHIFEPFFTTKEQGKGTGLGLATVYGIVKQNEGFINVYSEPGLGTTFKVYLPRTGAEGALPPAAGAVEPLRGGAETILMVEDEQVILELVKRMLEGLGYTVLTAGTPAEAIALVEGGYDGSIHLLITDVVLPEMNGRELAERLAVRRPGLQCLFMSGYTADVIAHRGVLDAGVRFLPKPFSADVLAAKVREALDAGN